LDAPTTCALEAIGTSLSRARCHHPARIERMKQSLIAYGQLNPLIAVEREKATELVDGFKRLFAAKALGWRSLRVTMRSFDERGQWAAMLMLNRGFASMTILEEALVLSELTKTGMKQSELSSFLSRDKSWVSRRIGLASKLHPELIESMKIGLLHPGVARRLLSLPPRNQLEIAAASQSAKLGARETEILVSLWLRAKDQQQRRAILYDPRAAIRAETMKRRHSVDLRLTPTGQHLERSLRRLRDEAAKMIGLLGSLQQPEDLQLLAKEILATRKIAQRLVAVLGSRGNNGSDGEQDVPSETEEFSTSTTREKETRRSPRSSRST
jgi:ParB family chromosome partitioning protein